MKRTKQIVSIGIALFFSVTTLKSDKVIAAPACENIPSCGVAGIVVGTQIIGGILYYLVKNAAGVVHKIPAIATPLPAHRTTQSGEDYLGKVIAIGMVTSRKECEDIAKRYSRERGGKWEIIYSGVGVSTPEGSDGAMPSVPLYYCQIQKVE